MSRAGGHGGASDHFEVALLAGVPHGRLPARRVAAWRAGSESRTSREGVQVAVAEGPDVVVFDASGGTRSRRVAADRRVLVVGPGHDFGATLNGYRLRIAHLGVAIGCQLEGASSLRRLELEPLGPLVGRVAVFSAGTTDVTGLDADVVHVSRNLGDREALARELRTVDADTYLDRAQGRGDRARWPRTRSPGGRGLVLATGNRAHVFPPVLDEALLALAPAARRSERPPERRLPTPLR